METTMGISDRRATLILRIILFAAIVAGAGLIVGAIDAGVVFLTQTTTLGELTAFVERFVFAVILFERVWSWLSRRVWIGQQAK